MQPSSAHCLFACQLSAHKEGEMEVPESIAEDLVLVSELCHANGEHYASLLIETSTEQYYDVLDSHRNAHFQLIKSLQVGPYIRRTGSNLDPVGTTFTLIDPRPASWTRWWFETTTLSWPKSLSQYPGRKSHTGCSSTTTRLSRDPRRKAI